MRMHTKIIAAMLVIAIPNLSYANCVASGNATHKILSQAQLTSLIVGSTACVAKSGGGWENQEQHSGGTVTDYKKGPTDPIDPSKAIGTYTISADSNGGIINYSYTGGGAYTYYLYGNTAFPNPPAGNYDFCTTPGSGASVTVAVKKSIGSCP